MIGIAAQPDATVTAYVPGIVGLVLGYMLLSTLISKLQEWRSPEAATKGGEALSASRRPVVGTISCAVPLGRFDARLHGVRG